MKPTDQAAPIYFIGDHVLFKTPSMKQWRTGQIVGIGNPHRHPGCWRVRQDGILSPTTIHHAYIAKIANEYIAKMAKEHL